MGGTPCWKKGSVRSPSPEEEEVTESMCDEPASMPGTSDGGTRENEE